MNMNNQLKNYSDKQRVNRSDIFRELWTMFRYGLVGLMNTGIFAFFAWLLRSTGLHYTVYTLTAYGIAIVSSFVMNAIFTFRKRNFSFFFLFTRFLLAALLLAGLVQLIQLFVIEILKWTEIIGVIGGAGFYNIAGYLINRTWVFKGAKEVLNRTA